MKTHYQDRAGFTLIEVVAVLILTSLAFVFASMLLVTFTGVFISNKEAVEDSQKIQVAMNRLVKELTYASNPSSSVGTVSWTSSHPERSGEPQQTATLTGSNLTLQGAVLLDNVSAFTVTSTAGKITISLTSARSSGVTHTTIVHPR